MKSEAFLKNEELVSKESRELLCIHCSTPVPAHLVASQEKTEYAFCCVGCETVYRLLNSKGLSHYYELKKKSAAFRQAKPADPSDETYAYLDDPAFIKAYCGKSENPSMDFYLEGVHCVACLWLVEKLPEIVEGVQKAELDLGKSIARISLQDQGSFSKVARELDDLGYRPHPICKDEEAEILQKKENRSMLIKLGVAASCTGNLMLMAVSLYGGANGDLAQLFRWVSLFLFLPILFYSAIPFYKSALTALRTRSLSIDVPIVAALALGGGVSVWNLRSENLPIYFDSLAALIFLLLSSRYVLKRIQQGVLSSSHLLHFLTPSFAKLWNVEKNKVSQIRVDALKKGDWIEVLPGEAIPVDGVVVLGKSALNVALLTGESLPQSVEVGDKVFSGTVNQDSRLLIEVWGVGAQTRLGEILKKVDEGSLHKAAIVSLADRFSRYFVMGVLCLAAAIILLNWNEWWTVGLHRALALVIVTCPCALALATPLAMSVTLGKTARQGMLIKGADTLEKLSQIKNVFLDKTGTLTEGRFEVLRWVEMVDAQSIQKAVLALEMRSKHPIAQALVRYLSPLTGFLSAEEMNIEITDFKENLGRGVEGIIDHHHYEIKALHLSTESSLSLANLETRIGVWRDGYLVAQGSFGDKIREDSKKAVDQMRRLGLLPYILSGDQASVVKKVGDYLNIPYCQRVYSASPEEKENIVKQTKYSLMLGDGANDAIALTAAYVGVAAHGSMEVSLRAADVYLAESGVMPVVKLIENSRETMKVIYRNFAFSLLYNLLGGLAAVMGWVNPLVAALLMPASSLTVFVSSLLGTRKLRRNLGTKTRR